MTSPATTGATLVPSSTATTDVAARMVARTNQYRQQAGCPALVPDERLTRAAQRHTEDMALNDQYGHTGSDGSSPGARMAAAGYRWSVSAENVAAGFTTPEAVVDAWFNETPPNDGHRRNILNCALRDVGIGYYALADDDGAFTYHTYWTQDLAAP